jgi:hypothetical protein
MSEDLPRDASSILHHDLVFEIFNNLTAEQRCIASFTCKQWRAIYINRFPRTKLSLNKLFAHREYINKGVILLFPASLYTKILTVISCCVRSTRFERNGPKAHFQNFVHDPLADHEQNSGNGPLAHSSNRVLRTHDHNYFF